MHLNYYHSFSIGFNYYYVAIPILAIVGILIGPLKYSNVNGYIVKKRYINKRLFRFYKILASFIATIMFAFESCYGIIQFFNNSLSANESQLPSLLIGFPCTIIAFYTIVYCFVFEMAIALGESLKYWYLTEIKHLAEKK